MISSAHTAYFHILLPTRILPFFLSLPAGAEKWFRGFGIEMHLFYYFG